MGEILELEIGMVTILSEGMLCKRRLAFDAICFFFVMFLQSIKHSNRAIPRLQIQLLLKR